jgi:hypothetical protein
MAKKNKKGAGALTAILAFVGVARGETLVQLDYGWRSDGKASCTPGFLAEEPWRRFACLDPVADFENYAARLDAQFLSNSLCNGITFIRFPWGVSNSKFTLEQGSAILKRPHWHFWLDPCITGYDGQYWSLSNQKEQVFKGSGKVNEIVKQACSLIGNRGGEMLQ